MKSHRPAAIALSLFVGMSVAISCGARSSQSGAGRDARPDGPASLPAQAREEIEALPAAGVVALGRQPALGAYQLYESIDEAAWISFDAEEYCVVNVERYQGRGAGTPVADLGQDELVGGASCAPQSLS